MMLSKTFFALGTINTITAFGTNCEEALNAACGRVLEIDERMSAFKDNSDIMKMNRCAGSKMQEIHSDTFEVLKRALEFCSASKGAFDITIRPLTALWRSGIKNNAIPNEEDIQRTLKLVNYRDLILDDAGTAAGMKKKGQAIDLGGIAKGYAADEVKQVLMRYGIENAMVNLGGNIAAIGQSPEGAPWRIGIQNPLSVRGEYIGTITTENKTIVTSGSNEQFFMKDGVRYHHIIDPRTGYPAQKGLLSVTVLCDSSIEADAVTTALFVQDISEAIPLLKKIQADAIFVMQNKDLFITEGLINHFERSERK